MLSEVSEAVSTWHIFEETLPQGIVRTIRTAHTSMLVEF